MIEITFYKNGARVFGHDELAICELISYATWACACDCRREDEDGTNYYASGITKGHENDGISWFEINYENEDVNKIYQRYIDHLEKWVTYEYGDRVKFIHKPNDFLDKINFH